MNKTIYVSLVHDRKKKAGRQGEAPVEVRLTQNRRSVYYSTGVRVRRKHWHNGQVVNRIDAREIQVRVDRALVRARQVINELEVDGHCDIRDVVAALRSKADTQSFLDFCEERAEVRSHGRSEDSRERYQRFMRFLRKYGKITSFSDVTDKAVVELDSHLAATGMKPYSKWNNYHRFLNSFVLDAIEAGLLTRNPYKHVHIDKEKSSGGIGKYLSMEEFRRIEQCDPGTECLERVRDLFVFQTYTCLSFTDLVAFKAGQIRYIGDKPVYTSKRGKTKQEFTFLVLPPAMAILRKYDNQLPLISNVKYNLYLKALAQFAGIGKPLSSHWARHTGATMLLNEGGLDMEIVAKVLGHSSTKITRQVYAKLLDETVVDAMGKMKC